MTVQLFTSYYTNFVCAYVRNVPVIHLRFVHTGCGAVCCGTAAPRSNSYDVNTLSLFNVFDYSSGPQTHC